MQPFWDFRPMILALKDEIIYCPNGHATFRCMDDIETNQLIILAQKFRSVNPKLPDPIPGNIVLFCPECEGYPLHTIRYRRSIFGGENGNALYRLFCIQHGISTLP
jgi:hypothetical protein